MTMQLIEAAVFLCAAAVLLGMTVWLVRRRTS
jgi:predicted small integral membrane protein